MANTNAMTANIHRLFQWLSTPPLLVWPCRHCSSPLPFLLWEPVWPDGALGGRRDLLTANQGVQSSGAMERRSWKDESQQRSWSSSPWSPGGLRIQEQAWVHSFPMHAACCGESMLLLRRTAGEWNGKERQGQKSREAVSGLPFQHPLSPRGKGGLKLVTQLSWQMVWNLATKKYKGAWRNRRGLPWRLGSAHACCSPHASGTLQWSLAQIPALCGQRAPHAPCCGAFFSRDS